MKDTSPLSPAPKVQVLRGSEASKQAICGDRNRHNTGAATKHSFGLFFAVFVVFFVNLW